VLVVELVVDVELVVLVVVLVAKASASLAQVAENPDVAVFI
jgi:hypothetical protein